MKYVKLVWKDFDSEYDLTIGKVYDVVKYTKAIKESNDTVRIINDKGIQYTFYLRTGSNIYFEDAMVEYRAGVIDEILH